MWRRHREENSKTPRMENKRKKILPSFLGMTKPTMVKLGNSFKCSLCKKTGDYPALVPHIQTHARNVMSYRGVQIYRCGLDCAQAPHHHCCFCNKTIINKHCFLRHLKTCDEGNLSPQRSFSCSTPQITAVFHTIPGTTMLQAVTTTSTKATTSIAPGKSQGPATTPLILQAVPSLALQTSVAPSSSSAALPSQAAAAKQSSTDASSSAKQASESSDASSLAKRVSTDAASPEKESSDKPEADGSSSHPQQQSPLSESQAAAFIPPLSPLLSTPTKTIPSSSSSSSSSQPQPTTVRVSVSQQPPTAMSPEHEELEESVLSISDTLHLPTSSTPSPPPIDSLTPLFASEECSSPAPAANAVSSSSYREKSRERVKCPHCPTQLIRRNLKVHINRHHKDILVEARVKSQFRSLYVDAKNGILAVQRHTHGFLAPVHVQKGSHGGGSRAGADMQAGGGEGEGQLQPQGPRCDLRACQQFQQMSERHGLTVSHCQHTRHADPRALTAAEEHLNGKILDEMVAAKILTEAKRAMCLRRQKMAQVAKVPFSVHVDLEGSPKRMFLSVHEPRANDYSCLGRVMVSYDVDSNVWLCPCTKGPMSCLHKSIARWHVFQTHRDLFKPPPTSCARDNKPSGGAWDNMEFGANANGGGGSSNSTYALNSDVKRSVDYIYQHKRIPAAADLPGELTSTVLEFPGQLFPSETTCGMCGCAPALEEAENVTYQGKIVTMMGVADYVSTFIRRCPMCHMVYRYQEWRDGLHNFNNHLLLSIELCLYFRHSLQNNIPITKAVKTLESLRKTSYPAVETLLTAYSHFEAMMSPDADGHPDCCASPAPVTDLHKKAFLVLHWS